MKANLSHSHEYNPDWVTHLREMQSQLLEVGKKTTASSSKVYGLIINESISFMDYTSNLKMKMGLIRHIATPIEAHAER